MGLASRGKQQVAQSTGLDRNFELDLHRRYRPKQLKVTNRRKQQNMSEINVLKVLMSNTSVEAAALAAGKYLRCRRAVNTPGTSGFLEKGGDILSLCPSIHADLSLLKKAR